MNIATYAVDLPSETIQERLTSLRNFLNVTIDIESDARRKADEIRKDIEQLEAPKLEEVNDDEL
jgi:putative lipoic acid-binding regulatory protein